MFLLIMKAIYLKICNVVDSFEKKWQVITRYRIDALYLMHNFNQLRWLAAYCVISGDQLFQICPTLNWNSVSFRNSALF